jgi:hypothetical protein
MRQRVEERRGGRKEGREGGRNGRREGAPFPTTLEMSVKNQPSSSCLLAQLLRDCSV